MKRNNNRITRQLALQFDEAAAAHTQPHAPEPHTSVTAAPEHEKYALAALALILLGLIL